MACPETSCCSDHIDLDPPATVYLQFTSVRFQTDNAVADIDRTPIRIDVAQPANKVAICGLGFYIKLKPYMTDHIQVMIEFGACINQ